MRTEREAETIRRQARDDDRPDSEVLASGRFAEPRSWLSRARDEVAAWFGDTGAMRRRQWDEASGDHTGRGPTRIVDADTVIVETLIHRLTIDPELDASDIKVTCEGRVVALEGSVRTSAAAQRAEGLASAVGGVDRVANKLVVA